jgi:RimJ/RimL family protein N-acetyltransferase
MTAPTLVFRADDAVAAWVGLQLGFEFKGAYAAIGIARAGEAIGGVVYTGYCQAPHMIEASIATTDRRWASRHVLMGLFAFPFVQLGVERLQTRAHRRARKIRKFNLDLGFKFEGIMRRGWPLGGDAAVYSMLPDECRWLGELKNAVARPDLRAA